MEPALDRLPRHKDDRFTVDQDRQAGPLLDPKLAPDCSRNHNTALWSHFYNVSVTHSNIVTLSSQPRNTSNSVRAGIGYDT